MGEKDDCEGGGGRLEVVTVCLFGLGNLTFIREKSGNFAH